jgi:hypothetical protein
VTRWLINVLIAAVPDWLVRSIANIQSRLGPKVMDESTLKATYGPEYPDAALFSGVRMPLKRDGRFNRYYTPEDGKGGAIVSKFSDGSATMSFEQLQREWPDWSPGDRQEFCGACSWLGRQADFPDMLRFIMRHGGERHWNLIALQVAAYLPREDAYQALLHVLPQLKGGTANISQGIARTRHPKARAELSSLLERLWADPKLWDDDPFMNWPAFNVLCCIQHLLELGVSPRAHEQKVRLLSEHKCLGNRGSCSSYLRMYYPWLPEPEWPPSRQS